MNKQLTVIVPGFNEEKNIGRCLDSLVNQTSDEIEILVIDDGSTDNTKDVVMSYVSKYSNIKYLYKENGGISSARNLGINNIDTPYFGFVDSDDYVEPEMFEVMLNKIREEESDVCVCNFIWEFPNKSVIHKEGPYTSGSSMIIGLMATLWNKIYKTELIEKFDLMFPDGYRYEDTYFLLCLAANNFKISFVDSAFVHYVQHSSSIVHTNNEKVKDMIDVFKLVENYYDTKGLSKKYSNELEFVYAKYFLGSSFLRTCQIKDKKIRNDLLKEHVYTLYNKYPNFKKNKYLDSFSFFKRMYYVIINQKNYKIIGNTIHKFKKGV